MLSNIALLEIEPSDGAFFLLYCDAEGLCLADTWHTSLEDAKHQARSEFGIENEDWQEVAQRRCVAAVPETFPEDPRGAPPGGPHRGCLSRASMLDCLDVVSAQTRGASLSGGHEVAGTREDGAASRSGADGGSTAGTYWGFALSQARQSAVRL